MPISVIPYRSSRVCPVISRHRSSVRTGNAADPDIIRRSVRAPSDRARLTSAGAWSHDAISRWYIVGTAVKTVISPDASRAHTRSTSNSDTISQVARTASAQPSPLMTPCT
jgi:hypothetical protein